VGGRWEEGSVFETQYNSIQNNDDKFFIVCNPLIEGSKLMDKYDIRPNDSSSVIVSKVTNHFRDIVVNLQM